MKDRSTSARNRQPGTWGRFLGALFVLVAVAVGIPVGLAALTRWAVGSWHPIPGFGGFDAIGNYLGRGLTTSELTPILLRAALVVSWLVWLVIAWSVLASVISTRPSIQQWQLPRLALGEGLGRWIAAGLTALTALTPRVTAAAGPATMPAAMAAVVDDAPTSTHVVSSPATLARPGWGIVQPGESIEMFAARTLDDGSRWPEVWELNRGRTVDADGSTWREAWRVEEGWELKLPAAASTNGLRVVDVPTSTPSSRPPAAAENVGSPAEAVKVVVESGDSYWTIAAEHLRARLDREPTDAQVHALTALLVEHNWERLGTLDDPVMVHAGDTVMVPAGSVTPATSTVTDATAHYVAVPGDSYWEIATKILRMQPGAGEPVETEIHALTQRLLGRNSPRLGTADQPAMIRSGDIVEIMVTAELADAPVFSVDAPAPSPEPPVADDTAVAQPTADADGTSTPTAPPPTTVEANDAGGPADEEPAATTVVPAEPGAAPGVALPAPPRPSLPNPTPTSTPAPRSTPDAPVPTADQTVATVMSEASASPRGGSQVPAGALAGMSGLALAGVAMGWRRRRRRAVQRHVRPHQRPAPLDPVERELLSDPVVSDVVWLGQELRLLTHRLPPSARADLTVQLVQLGPGRDLEVAFAGIPDTAPPPGWRAAAERVWRLTEPHRSEELADIAELPPVVPALVTLGDHDESHLLANLELPAGVNVAGDDDQVAAWIAGAVWEIAGEALGEHPTVLLVDVDVPGAEVLSTVTSMTAVDAAAAVDEAIGGGPEGSMLARRVSQWEAWPPTVVVLPASVVDEAWIERASSPAVAVIAIGDAFPAGVDIVIDDGVLRVPCWDLEVPASMLAASVANAAARVLASSHENAVIDDEFEVAVAVPSTPIDVDADDDWEVPAPRVLVSLLGEPTVTIDRERVAVSPQQMAALAFLAVRRDVSVDQFTEAIWGDGAVVPSQRIRDLLMAIRSKAGGTTAIGAIEDRRIRVGNELDTDLAMFEALTQRIDEVPDEFVRRMHQILDLVAGRPFAFASTAAASWSWVDAESLEAVWGMRVSTVAWELAGVYLDRHDPAAARDIAERGLVADPLNAALTERLMESYAGLRSLEAAQRVFEAHDRALSLRGFDGASADTRRVLERLRSAHDAALDDAVETVGS